MADPVRIGSGSILLVPDARQFRRQANADLSRIELNHRVQLQPTLRVGEYRREAQSQIERVLLRHAVHLRPELQAGFRADARGQVMAALRGLDRAVTLRVDVSTALASSQMAAWRREQEARPVRIRVVTERTPGAAGGAGTAARDAERALPSGFNQRSSGLLIPVSLDERAMRDVTQKLDQFGKENFNDGGRAPRGRNASRFRITPDIPDLRNDPAIRNAMRRQSYAFNDAFRLRIQPNLAGLQLRLPLGGLGLAAIPEMATQIGGLTAAMTQAAQTALLLPGAFASIGAVVATAAVGITGLKEAWKALSTEEKNSSQTELQQREARRAVIDAVNEEQRARRSLTDAVQNEQRRQRDLQLELRGSKLTEAEAILAVQDAEAAIREGHFANTREYDHALLSYEESKQRLLEVRNKNADLAQDVAKNERTGVQGSDAVLNATQALTAATERVADAQMKLAEGGTALDQARAKAQDAMNKLAPSAREFVQTLFDLRPALRQFANDIQEPLFRGLGPAINNLFNSPAIQTNLRTGMAGLAATMNGIITDTMGRLGDTRSGGFITRIFGNTTDAGDRFRAQVLNPLITGLGTLTAAGTDSLPRIVDAMGQMATKFSTFIQLADKDGSLKHWIDQGLDAFTMFGRIIGNLWDSLQGISRAFGGSFLGNIEALTQKLSNFLNSAQGQQDLKNFISETRVAMEAWKPILADLPELMTTAFETGRTAVATFLPILQLALDVLRSCPGLIQGVVTAFVAWKVISPIVTGMQGAMNLFSQTITNVRTGFGPMKAEGAKAAQEVDNAFKNAAGEGGAIHRTARATSNLAGMLQMGGPLAAAITTGAMFVLDLWIKKQEDAALVTENLRHEQERLADTLDRTTGLVTQQTRESIAHSFADFKPQDKGGLSGNVLQAAAALGLGGANGQDLVTAALPAGGPQYEDIMGHLRDRIRPQVRDFIQNQGIDLGRAHITEDDVVNAFLGQPEALDKIRNVKQFGVQAIDLGTLASQVMHGGGQGLQAALVGQALNEQKFGVQGAGAVAGQAAGAARLPVSLNPATAGIFGGQAKASAANGEYKIVSDVDPSSPQMQSLMKDPNSGVTAAENPPGVTPYKSWTYTLTRAQAQKYMTGVPQYRSGGETNAGLAVLHNDEFVMRPEATRTYGMDLMHGMNEMKIPPESLPHFDVGGPVKDFTSLDPNQMDFHGHIVQKPQSMDDLRSLTDLWGHHDDAAAHELFPSSSMIPHYDVGGPYPPDDPNLKNLGPPLKDVGGDPNLKTAGGPAGALPTITGDSFGPFGQAKNQLGIGDIGNTQNAGLGILGQFLGIGGLGGGGGGGKGSAPDLGAYAARFGGILMQGVLGFFGINPQYINDIDKVLGFGLGKLGGGGIDPSAQAAIENKIIGYENDGTPIYSLGTGSGTALPDANSTGTGAGAAASAAGVANNVVTATGGGGAGTTPGGQQVGVNPASRSNFGGSSPPTITPALLKAQGIQPLYAWNDQTRKNPSSAVPGWVQNLAKQFGLTASTYASGGTLHEGGYAFDFNDPDAKGGDSPKMDAFAQFVQDHLAGQTLQLIHANPTTGQKWGIAAGTAVGSPGTANPSYYSGDFSGHYDHVHWATDVPVAVGPATGAATPWAIAGAAPGGGSGSGDTWWGLNLANLPPRLAAGAGGGGAGTGGTGAGTGRGGAPRGAILWSPKHGILGYSGGGADLFGGGGAAAAGFGGVGGQGSANVATPAGLSGIKAKAYQMYIAAGMPADEWGDFDQLIEHESSWNPTNKNPGSTAYGLGQFLDSTWGSVGGVKTDDPMQQLQYIFAYLKGRQDYHGSPRAAWQLWQSRQPHWYASGGLLYPGINMALVEPGNGPELVVNQQQQARIAQALAAQATPADPNRSGVAIPPEITRQIPNQIQHIGPPQPAPQPPPGPSAGPMAPTQTPGLAPVAPPPPAPPEPEAPQPIQPPPPTPIQELPQPSGAPGAAASTVPVVGAGERPEQPDVAPAPASRDHELPALKTGITSGFAAAGNAAAMAAAIGGAGMGGGAAGSLISGLFTEGGKIANAVANVISSAGVGTITSGTTENPYGAPIKGEQAPQTLPMDNSTHYHGDLYANDMDDFFRRQELRESQHLQTQLAARPGF